MERSLEVNAEVYRATDPLYRSSVVLVAHCSILSGYIIITPVLLLIA
jgi:hypothetical protein